MSDPVKLITWIVGLLTVAGGAASFIWGQVIISNQHDSQLAIEQAILKTRQDVILGRLDEMKQMLEKRK